MILFDELKTGFVAIEIDNQPDGHDQRRHGGGRGDPANQLGVIGQRQHDCRSGEWNEGHISKQVFHIPKFSPEISSSSGS